MYEYGYKHGLNASSTGMGAQLSDPEYLRGFSDGFKDDRDTVARNAARLEMAAASLAWTDHMHSSVAHHGVETYQVEEMGTSWGVMVATPGRLLCVDRRPNREMAKALAVLTLAQSL